jgi:hypothetical protein
MKINTTTHPNGVISKFKRKREVIVIKKPKGNLIIIKRPLTKYENLDIKCADTFVKDDIINTCIGLTDESLEVLFYTIGTYLESIKVK